MNVDALFVGIAIIVGMYSWKPTRPASVLLAVVLVVGVILRFQGNILSQVKALFPAWTASQKSGSGGGMME